MLKYDSLLIIFNMAKLLEYQEPHVAKLIKALEKYNIALDASDTGTGKTYSAIAIAKRLNLRPVIICPKCVINSWTKVAKTFEVDPILITNYDQIIAPWITSTKQQEELILALAESKIMDKFLDEADKAETKSKSESESKTDPNKTKSDLDKTKTDPNKTSSLDNISSVSKSKSKIKSKSESKTKTKTKTKSTDQSRLTKHNKTKSSVQIKPYLEYCKKKFKNANLDNSDSDSEPEANTVNDNDEAAEAIEAVEDIGIGAKAKTKGKSKSKSKSAKTKTKSKSKPKEELQTFEWTIPDKSILIFDEVHRCKNSKTLHYKLLVSIREYLSKDMKCLILSATIADKVKYFAPVAYLLGWINDYDESFPKWIKKKSVDVGFPIGKTIHHMLFPFYGSRLRISELGDLFPHNQILPECYDMENAGEIENQYMIIQKALGDLREKKESARCILEIILRARQMIELLKYPTFCELIEDHLENDLSVVVFVNFNETLLKLAKTFNTDSVVHGKQTQEQRQKIIDDFQANRTNILIANIKAGGVGISLHDIHGEHQRVSIISPTWSAQDTMQTLGRIHRAEGKTPAIQKFVFCAGTIEEYICEKLREKLDNLSLINDGVLHPFPKLDTDCDVNEDGKISVSSYLNI